MGRVLVAAGVYNLLWGAFAVLAPTLPFAWLGIEPPRYPELWQCIGMIVGVYGVGYLAAARDPFRHWPIVLVGLLGKVFGPVGYVWSASRGALPWEGGLTIVTNDLIWWLPFGLILAGAFRRWREEPERPQASLAGALSRATDQHHRSLDSLSREGPVLVVFLRHFGCTFCREALADLAAVRERLAADGVRPVVVHMSDEARAREFLDGYGLADVARISDPERVLYRAFDLRRGGLGQLFGAKVWWRGLRAGLLDGHGVGALDGDGFQMPGAFLVRDGRILRRFAHRSAADRPDYCELAGGDVGGGRAPTVEPGASDLSPAGT